MAEKVKSDGKFLILGALAVLVVVVVIIAVINSGSQGESGTASNQPAANVQAKPPDFGTSPAEVEKYCGAPDAHHKIDRPEATVVIVKYEKTELKECHGTFTFVNDKLNSIEPLDY